ncbi:MAG TPA: hypothetical protein VNA27_16860 [Rubrobacteraceae bacterium]|nr:hypothetical protein [Rubrobacteraceae bacterium]
MTAPLNPSILDSLPETLMILFRIIPRQSWGELQELHEAFPGSCVEHILHGVYVLVVLLGGAKELTE